MLLADKLLQGAIDTHAHGYPEFTLNRPPRVDVLEWARLAIASSMRGFVIKSHVWPTTGIAHLLRTLHPDLETYGSITLNPPAGGLDPVSVELAAQMGARVVWMPTWSARHVPPRHSITLERMRPLVSTLDVAAAQGEAALGVLDSGGRLTPNVKTILDVCARYGVTVASGHLPAEPCLVLATEAAERGVRFVVTHPLSAAVGMSIDDQRRVAATGGFIEHVWIGCMPMHQRSDPRAIAEAIQAVGPQHCIMASDAGEAWNPPAPEVLRMFIASMLALGLDEDAVYLMTHDNPARALGLPPTAPADPTT